MDRFLASIAAFRNVDESALRAVEEGSGHLKLQAGEILCRQGDRDEAFYVVVSGSLQVQVTLSDGEQRRLTQLNSGDCVGESAVLFQKPSAVTVSASCDSDLLKISAPALHRLFAIDPAAHQGLLELASRRLLSLHLASLPLFDGIDLTTLQQFNGDANWLRLAGGETLFTQGDPPDYLYIVVHGRLEVVVARESGEHSVVARLGPGACVGEMALLTGEPRSATVRAVRNSELARLSKREFDLMLDGHSRAATEIARTLVRRLRETTVTAAPKPRVATIALVPSNNDGFPAGFIDKFVSALSAVGGSALHIDRHRVDLELGCRSTAMLADEALQSPILSWLNEQEDSFRHIVLECDAASSPWTDLCVRQADLILVVASADSDPRPGAIEDRLSRASLGARPTTMELVLVHHDGRRQPAGTANWIGARKLVGHHHVRHDCVGDYYRLARSATGRAVGVVFGGGGARGYLHIGVIRALRERGIPIDVVGGTSMGALAAAQCALEVDTERMVEVSTTGYGRNLGGINFLRDATLPIVAFLSGRRTVKMLQDVYQDTHIEDMWLPYFCVSASLSTARVVVHQDGPLWLAIRASLSVPGILPPVLVNGEMLVDGGLLNNLPVNTMRSRAGTVIAVDVASQVDLTVASPTCTAVSGWSHVRSRLNPFSRKTSLPHIFDILTRATTLGAIHNTEAFKKEADLYLHPVAAGVGTLDWKAGRNLIEVGYRYAQTELEKWNGDAVVGFRSDDRHA
jgi:predicted acylesterase/phospholipase RssA/CRP-like cAMP-binding protein